MAALTGYLAAYDGEFLNGLKLAVKVINGKGGADGHPLNLHILDGASNATTGATVTNQLLNQYNVSIMLNGASSATSVAIHPMVADAKVPIIILSQLPPDAKWAFLSTTAFSRVTRARAAIHHQIPEGEEDRHPLQPDAGGSGRDQEH